MANPAIKQLTADTWALVAENVTGGKLNRINTYPNKYIFTYRTTGDTAPVNQSEGVPIFQDSNTAIIETDSGIDVYVMALGQNGTIRVDV